MELAFKINAFANRKNVFEYGASVIAEAGFKGIGLVFDKPFLWLEDTKPTKLSKILRFLERKDLKVVDVSSCTASGYYRPDNDFTPPGQRFGPSITSSDPEERALRVKHTKLVIDFALELGCRNVDTSTGYQPKDADFATTWKRARDCLIEMAEYADKKGVSLNIEYEPGEFGPGGLFVGDVHTFLAMANDVGYPCLKANWDCIHSWVASEDLPETIRLLANNNRLGIVELDDGARIADEQGFLRRRHYHLVPGTGEIDYYPVFEALKEVDFRGPVIIELYSLYNSVSPSPEEACCMSYVYIRENFGHYFK